MAEVNEYKIKFTADSKTAKQEFDRLSAALEQVAKSEDAVAEKAKKVNKHLSEFYSKKNHKNWAALSGIRNNAMQLIGEYNTNQEEKTKQDKYRSELNKKLAAQKAQFSKLRVGNSNFLKYVELERGIIPEQVKGEPPETKTATINQPDTLTRLKDSFKGLYQYSSKSNAKLKDVSENLGIANRKLTTTERIVSKIKSISLYRFVRSAIMGVVNGLKEGINNLYQWDKALNGGFSKSLDTLSTSLLQVKNAFAVALAPAIQGVIVPAMQQFSEIIVNASNRLSEFISRLKGQSWYIAVNTKAIKEYAKAQRQVLGFDELNILGSNSTDYSDMFQRLDVGTGENKLLTLASGIQLKFDSFEVDFSDIAKFSAIGMVLNGLIGLLNNSAAGLTVGGTVGGVITTIAKGILTFQLLSYIFEDKSDEETAESKLEGIFENLPWLVSAAGGLYGATLGYKFGANGTFIGFFAGAALALGLTAIFFDSTEGLVDGATKSFIETFEKLSWVSAGFAGAFAGAKVGAMLGHPVAGALVGFTIGAALLIDILDISFNTPEIDEGDNIFGTPALLGNISEKWTQPGYKTIVSWIKEKFGLYADGGFVPQGDLFIANEAGPELVGTIGNRTAVTNQDQFVASVAGAMAPVIQAIYETGNANVSAIRTMPMPSVRIGDRDIFNASQRGSKLVGTSLVQGV